MLQQTVYSSQKGSCHTVTLRVPGPFILELALAREAREPKDRVTVANRSSPFWARDIAPPTPAGYTDEWGLVSQGWP